MQAKFVYESMDNVLKPKKLSPKEFKKWKWINEIKHELNKMYDYDMFEERQEELINKYSDLQYLFDNKTDPYEAAIIILFEDDPNWEKKYYYG